MLFRCASIGGVPEKCIGNAVFFQAIMRFVSPSASAAWPRLSLKDVGAFYFIQPMLQEISPGAALSFKPP